MCSLFSYSCLFNVCIGDMITLLCTVSLLCLGVNRLFMLTVLPLKIQLTHLAPPHFCSCPNTWHGFPTSYDVLFSMLNELSWEMIGRFYKFVELLSITLLTPLFIILDLCHSIFLGRCACCIFQFWHSYMLSVFFSFFLYLGVVVVVIVW